MKSHNFNNLDILDREKLHSGNQSKHQQSYDVGSVGKPTDIKHTPIKVYDQAGVSANNPVNMESIYNLTGNKVINNTNSKQSHYPATQVR
jgi:hypothetical protein